MIEIPYHIYTGCEKKEFIKEIKGYKDYWDIIDVEISTDDNIDQVIEKILTIFKNIKIQDIQDSYDYGEDLIPVFLDVNSIGICIYDIMVLRKENYQAYNYLLPVLKHYIEISYDEIEALEYNLSFYEDDNDYYNMIYNKSIFLDKQSFFNITIDNIKNDVYRDDIGIPDDIKLRVVRYMFNALDPRDYHQNRYDEAYDLSYTVFIYWNDEDHMWNFANDINTNNMGPVPCAPFYISNKEINNASQQWNDHISCLILLTEYLNEFNKYIE